MTNQNVQVSDVTSESHPELILRERARALSHPLRTADDTSALLEVLVFHLAHECYAVETHLVGEVHPLLDLTPLPCTPAFMRGIVNVRGRITPVIDIKRFFDLPDQGLTDLHRIILIRKDDLEIGLLADIIAGVRSIRANSLQPSLATLTGIRGEYLKGVTPERITVLDVERILQDPALIIDEEVKN